MICEIHRYFRADLIEPCLRALLGPRGRPIFALRTLREDRRSSGKLGLADRSDQFRRLGTLRVDLNFLIKNF